MHACARGCDIAGLGTMKFHTAMQQFLTSCDYRRRRVARPKTCRESGSCGKSGTPAKLGTLEEPQTSGNIYVLTGVREFGKL